MTSSVSWKDSTASVSWNRLSGDNVYTLKITERRNTGYEDIPPKGTQVNELRYEDTFAFPTQPNRRYIAELSCGELYAQTELYTFLTGHENDMDFEPMPDTKEAADQLMTTDKYPSDICNFIVHGAEGENGKAMLVGIENDLLAIALSNLPEQSRDVVLLAYCLDMTDVEIAEALNMPRSTVQYQRTSSLNKIKKHMEGK